MRKGISVSPGVAVGTAYCIHEIFVDPDTKRLEDNEVTAELANYETARDKAAAELRALHHKVAAQVGAPEAAIFAAHESILRDTAFTNKVRTWVVNDRLTAQAALHRLLDEYTILFAKTNDEYIKERVNDVRDVVGLQADLVFDSKGIGDGTLTPGAITAHHIVDSSNPGTGRRRFLLYSMTGSVLTNGELARIPFSVAPEEYRNFDLRLENVIFVRADASKVINKTVNGAMAVNQVFVGPSGQVDGFLEVATNDTERCFVIQATTDFRSWVNVQTNSTQETLLQFIDPAGETTPHRFYRAVFCDPATGLQLGSIAQLSGGTVQFDFTGADGRTYVIQASTNLTDWQNVRTNIGLASPITFVDPSTSLARRFYRVREGE